jgi:hypothetical protein
LDSQHASDGSSRLIGRLLDIKALFGTRRRRDTGFLIFKVLSQSQLIIVYIVGIFKCLQRVGASESFAFSVLQVQLEDVQMRVADYMRLQVLLDLLSHRFFL